MSGDQPISSFGEPNAQAPTPKQTPTSFVFPSPVFETPKNNHGSFENSSGWTPRFAEEYSVFNTTPGNLRASQAHFVDFPVSNPYGHKRPLSAENIAVEIATHVNHLSPNPSLHLPPVDPSRRLPSSPGPLTASHNPAESELSESQERGAKNIRREDPQEDQAQTATPPPSARKPERKLAPKLQMDRRRQDDPDYGQEFVAGTPMHDQHNLMQSFVTTPTDMFGYPMSAPATAPVFTWEVDATMHGMDMDFSTAGSGVFQTAGHHHRPMNSIDWARSNELFQETGLQPQNQDNHQRGKRESALAPKSSLSNIETHAQDASMFGASFTTPVNDSFDMMGPGGGVNPGLLYTQPPPVSMEPATYNPMAQVPLMPSVSQPDLLPIAAKPPVNGEARRVLSAKERGKAKKFERIATSSPTKPSSGRPGSLCISGESRRGRKAAYRSATLPTLAPAARPAPQQGGNRSVSHGSRPNGRSSPFKNGGDRVSSLTSIPESGPKTKTLVNFFIDSRGRAQTTVVATDGDDEPTPKAIRNRKKVRGNSSRQDWDFSDDGDSSTDDEPIIIPSRPTSFVLPDAKKPKTSYHFPSSQRSFSKQISSSLGIYNNEPSATNDGESEAETVMNESQSGRGGDAASELRKVVEDRQKRTTLSTSQQRFVSNGSRSGSSTISPTSDTRSGLPTPSHSNAVRCVCRKPRKAKTDYMVQCDSCDHELHGKCIKINQDTRPAVYICAFCANTPNGHGVRSRETGKSGRGRDRGGGGASPLAHKSIRSFR